MAELKKCPFTKKRCMGDECMMWITIQGENPQTGQRLDDTPGCAFQFLPLMQIETSKEVRGAAKATEQLRNRVVDAARAVMPPFFPGKLGSDTTQGLDHYDGPQKSQHGGS